LPIARTDNPLRAGNDAMRLVSDSGKEVETAVNVGFMRA
jgi:hypothetical protein